MTTIADIQERASENVYPADVLEGCETALILFAGGFVGAQDGAFVAEAGLRATCVDVREQGLRMMSEIYPPDWEYVCADALAFTETCDRQWDVVSVDCPSGMFEVCAKLGPRWCSLARRAVIVGTGHGTLVNVPVGWRISRVEWRSAFRGGVYWTVLQPAVQA